VSCDLLLVELLSQPALAISPTNKHPLSRNPRIDAS
jgi:hypothetical protein